MYNGIHYDPLALTFGETYSDEMDITIVSHDDINAFTKFTELAKDYQSKGDFVDFTDKAILKCADCDNVFQIKWKQQFMLLILIIGILMKCKKTF